MQNLRAIILDAYNRKQISIAEFAKGIGVMQSTAKKILSEDNRFISNRILRNISSFLGQDYESLLALQPAFPENGDIRTTSKTEWSDKDVADMRNYIKRTLEA